MNIILFLTWLNINIYSQLCSTARYDWITLRYYLYIPSVKRGRDTKTNRARHHWFMLVYMRFVCLSFGYLTTDSRLLNNKNPEDHTINFFFFLLDIATSTMQRNN